jgi:hypothetical protein
MGDTCRLPPQLSNMALTGTGVAAPNHMSHTLHHANNNAMLNNAISSAATVNSISSVANAAAVAAIQHQLLSTNAAGIEVTEGSMDSDSEDEDAAAVVSAMYQQHHQVHSSSVGFAPGTVGGGNNNAANGGNTGGGIGSTAVNASTVGPLAFVLEDIRRMEIPIGTIEEFLVRHDPSRSGTSGGGGVGSNGVVGSGSGTSSNTITNSNNPSNPSAGQPNVISALLGRTGNASCLLTDSHDFSVRNHQLVHLQEEFPEIDFIAFLEQCNKGGYISYTAITAQFAPLIKQLLVRLVDIERQYAEQVRASKQKDFMRASEVIVGTTNERNEIDETMIRAHTRAEDIQLVVHRIMSQL